MKWGQGRKKIDGKKIQKLTDELTGLEQKHKKHKCQLPQEIHHRMVIKRSELKTAMEQESRASFNKIAWERYRWGNKPSKQLAKMVQKKKARNFIERIQSKEGLMEYSTRKVAEIFKNYYKELYSVPKQDTSSKNRTLRYNNYIKKAALPKISEEGREFMERPISEEEISKALAGMALGKSPGPDGLTSG